MKEIINENNEKKTNKSIYKSYDELPLFLTAKIVATVLGISQAGGYDLMRTEGFPALRIGNRIVVPKEEFILWVSRKTNKLDTP